MLVEEERGVITAVAHAATTPMVTAMTLRLASASALITVASFCCLATTGRMAGASERHNSVAFFDASVPFSLSSATPAWQTDAPAWKKAAPIRQADAPARRGSHPQSYASKAKNCVMPAENHVGIRISCGTGLISGIIAASTRRHALPGCDSSSSRRFSARCPRQKRLTPPPCSGQKPLTGHPQDAHGRHTIWNDVHRTLRPR